MRNIRPKIMLLSSIMMLGILLSVVLGSYRAYSDSLENIIKESIERIAKESSWHLSNFLEGYLAPLNKLSENESIMTMDIEIQKQVLKNQVNPNYEEIGIVDKEGVAYYLDGDMLDLSDREYIKRALKGEKNISEVIVSRKTGNLVILAAVPIIKDGETKGALIARLNMNLLKRYISTRGFGESGKVYIISTGGSFLKISPDEEDVFNINIFEESKKMMNTKIFQN